MPKIELLDWERARGQAAPIRFAVFVEEQGVPFEIELDEYDPVSIHALAFEGAKARGDGQVALSAQVGALPFYRAHGFEPEGDEYMEAGIRHQAMRKTL